VAGGGPAGVQPGQVVEVQSARVDLVAQGLHLLQMGDEGVDDLRVEGLAPLLQQHLQCPVVAEGRAVAAVHRQCVEAVDDPGDGARERDRLSRNPARVPGPVPALVVRQGHFGCEL
jgi:hypothetical protein